jgi:AcrR family transcriptional regulator
MSTEDRRVRRTKQSLQTALTGLIVEKGYDKTTVQDLIDRADVGRSTFYAHYETKDDLLVSMLDHLTADFERHLTDDPAADESILPSLGIFRHIAENHRQYRALIGSRGIDLVHRAATDTLTEQALSAIQRGVGDRSDVPSEVRAAFVAGSLLTLLDWWLDHGMPYPPEAMAGIFQRLTASA